MPIPTQDVDIDTAFQTELTRLLALNLSPEQEEIARRYYSQKERQSMPQSSFCGPGRSFPITNQADVSNAAHLVGHAADPAAVKKCIIGKAKANGWSIPDSWKDGDKKDGKREEVPLIIRADGTHDAFTGKHTHPHAANNSQGGDANHEHSHSHDGDSDHGHAHGDVKKADTPDILRTPLPEVAHLYVPIDRIDKKKREVYGRATVEDVDAYRTIFSYEASKKAFREWMSGFGNVREMHDAKRAIGKAVQVQFDDENKQVLVKARISRSADGDNAWTKVEEGILSGFSVGATQGVWGKTERNGTQYDYLQEYRLAELSLVDRPATPGCTIEVARADGFISDVIESEDEPEEPEPPIEETPPETRAQTPDTTRAGARISHVTQDQLHGMRDGHLKSAKSTMELCACDECKTGCSAMDPDGDGDIDLMPTSALDWDSDGGAGGSGSGDGQSRATIAEIIREEIIRQMSPTITRMQGIAARLAMTDTTPQTTTTIAPPDPQLITRLDGLEHKFADVASSADLVEVRSLLSEVKELTTGVKSLTEQIAAQPQSGGPMVNSAALQQQPQYLQPDPLQEDAATVARLAKAGILNKNQQIDAVLYLQRASQQAQNGRR